MSYTVYKHTGPTGKVYIGITSQKPENRWGHEGKGYKHNPHFMAAIKTHGWEAFTHEIIAEGLTKEEAERLEVKLIAQYDSTNREKGYNAELGGNSPGRASADIRRKISESQRGEKHHYYGKHLSEEHRRKLSAAHKGKKYAPRSEEHRRKLSEVNKGKHPREETRQKLRAIKKGVPLSEEHRRKISEGLRGRRLTENNKTRLIEANRRAVRCLESGVVYSSIKEAARTTGAPAPNIGHACAGRRKTAGGFHWAYEEVIA